MMLKRFILSLLTFFGLSTVLMAQMTSDPTHWEYKVKKLSDDEFELQFHLKIDAPWHIWSLKPGGDGTLIAPNFNFEKSAAYKIIGGISESGNKKTVYLDVFEGEVTYLSGQIVYKQKIKALENTTIKGQHEYQVCTDESCLPPKTVPFEFKITDVKPKAQIEDTSSQSSLGAIANPDSNLIKVDTILKAEQDSLANVGRDQPSTTNAKEALVEGDVSEKEKPEKESLIWLFLASLGGGFLALLTPCVYSMVPITVSFFTKKSKTRKEGIRNAIYYASSIIIIFTLLGILITVLFGSNALNALSTNWLANLLFFVIFVVFGLSFLGAFEITLPSSWTSKTDSKAGLGSFSGLFFMALTLVIVSFSCTGPIIGPLLVIAGQGGLLGPTIGMLGFSIGLALPFALFAIFPGMLNKMASSGGWMNQVKVVLGFLELMLALKFLSNADLQMGWRLLDREIFIAIWIVLSILLGVYLLGKLKLSHDDANPKNVYGQEYVSIFKLLLAIVSFTFATYLLPGMWGAPLNGMSAFLPPMGTQDFVMGSGPSHTGNAGEQAGPQPQKYVELMRIYEPPAVVNMGLKTYFDYEEALAASKELKKPIMLDFTGVNCINCRKMEGQVWSQKEVIDRLKNDFIVVSLYCDLNSVKLPKEQQFESKALGGVWVETLGSLNTHIQASEFGSNTQPFYFFVDHNKQKLAEKGYSYDPDVQKFIAHLDAVKASYKKLHP